MSRALAHFLEHAAEVYLPRFETFFPAGFDWAGLCRDVPEMGRRRRSFAPPTTPDAALEAYARTVFCGAHLLGLALLAATGDEVMDPEDVLERLAVAPTDEEDDVFDGLVGRCLAVVEERLAGGEAEDGADGGAADVDEACSLVAGVWPLAADALAADEARVFERAGPDADLLWSLARVAVVLAAFRWMAATRCREGWPQE